jgi:hypothetical protein
MGHSFQSLQLSCGRWGPEFPHGLSSYGYVCPLKVSTFGVTKTTTNREYGHAALSCFDDAHVKVGLGCFAS